MSSSSQDFGNVMSQMALTLMTSMDTSNNNSIDKSEFQQAIDSLSGNSSNTSTSSSNADQIFSALDTNKDGTISSDELLSALKQAQSSDDASATQTSTKKSIEDLQSSLLQKILAAYGSTDTTTSSNASLIA
jgi:Ca2+-binding EF-hand superfamily protein